MEQNAFSLNIPTANDLNRHYDAQNRQYRQNLLDEQKKLVENSFANTTSNVVEFDTNYPLLPEITDELSSKGYSYGYHYVSANGQEPKCHVTISANRSSRLNRNADLLIPFRSMFNLLDPFQSPFLLNW